MVKGEFLSINCMLLGFSVATLMLAVPQQATASTPRKAEASARNNQPEMKLPPIEEPGVLLPYKPPTAVSTVHVTYLVLKLNKRRVYVYRDNKVVGSYPVAIGKPGWETPTGTFKVFQMERNPVWQHPYTGKIIDAGPDNPLGLRWIAFWTDGTNLIGFHGTPDESVMGRAISHGCVRMRNRDVSAMFDQVEIGTPVTVEP